MDNAPVPKSKVYLVVFDQFNVQRVQNLCDVAGVLLDYLPLYSPDFNPTEEAFAEMKAWMKKNNELQAGYSFFKVLRGSALTYVK